MKVGQRFHLIVGKEDMVTNGTLNSREGEGGSSISTFFLTSFADKLRAKDLYEVLNDMGDIDKVIIPPKRDKRGNKYNFVRFFNVRDERSMTTKLDNTFIEGRKLFDNLPRFQRKEIREKFLEAKGKGREVKDNLGVRVAQSRGYRGTSEKFSKNQSFQFRGIKNVCGGD